MSGMPLDQALAAVAEQADDARAAKLAGNLRAHVAAGESLPAALARYPRAFSPLYRGLVGAGAETGRLAEVLSRLADYLEAREALRQKVMLALIYPMVVTVIAFAVIARPARLRRAAGRVGVSAEPADAAVAHAGADRDERVLSRDRMALARRASRRRASRSRSRCRRARFARAGTRSCCACRSSGRLFRSLDTARFASTLAILVGSGAPLLRSLDAAADVVRRCRCAKRRARAAGLVREGVALSRALREQKVFPPVLVHLVANGEQSGRLAPMLERAAGRARARRRAPSRVARRAAAAGADRRHGRDRAGARARRDAADRVDEPADPLDSKR